MALTGGVSFAFGGSTSGYLNQMPGGLFVPGVLGQIELYRKASSRASSQKLELYVIWSGANDYLMGRTEQPRGSGRKHCKSYTNALFAGRARFPRRPTFPDLGLTPMVQMTEREVQPNSWRLPRATTALLAQALNQLKPRLRGIQIFHVDLFTLSQNLLSRYR